MTKSPQDPRDRTYSISELAGEFDVSSRTIRFYEEKRLISPKRGKGNQRRYTKRDRARLKLILRGKRFGYSLDEIAEMIGMTDVDFNEVDQIKKSLVYGEKKLAEIRNRIEELRLLEHDLLNVKARLEGRLVQIEAESASTE
ncbi:MAG: MerR family DNA-binding transcriptional regulator [Thermodesulfobacteriota bacterium]